MAGTRVTCISPESPGEATVPETTARSWGEKKGEETPKQTVCTLVVSDPEAGLAPREALGEPLTSIPSERSQQTPEPCLPAGAKQCFLAGD